MPGEKIAVRVAVDASRLRSGAAKKLVWVFAQGSAQPVATLELLGEVRSPVTFSIPVLNFGKVSAEQGATLPLSVTFDSRLLPSDVISPLICTISNVQFVPDAASPVHVPVTQENGARMVTRTYQIRIPPGAAVGKLNGTISFVQMPAISMANKDDRTAPSAVLLGMPVIVIGEVVGVTSTNGSAK